MSTNGMVIHCIGWGCHPLTPRKYTLLNGNFVFDLCDIFKECNPDVKRDLPVFTGEWNNWNVCRCCRKDFKNVEFRLGILCKATCCIMYWPNIIGHCLWISVFAVGLGIMFRALVITTVAFPADIQSRKFSNTTHNVSQWIKKKIHMLFRSL